MQYHDYYATLDVKKESSANEIQRAYRKLARQYHPDINKEEGAENRFKDIGEARTNVCSGSLADEIEASRLRPLFYAKRTCGTGMSALGWKADVIGDLQKSPLIAKSGH